MNQDISISVSFSDPELALQEKRKSFKVSNI